MDIIQFQYFKAIAETGSLTKAARQLHVSQPAMSAMLKKFEQELQVTLFDRSPNRIQLNPLGETALVHTEEILKDIEQMRADLLSLSRQELSLSVGFCDPGVQWYCIPRFSYAHPDIRISEELYGNTDLVQALLERVYDIAVTPEPVSHTGIRSRPFLEDQVYLSVSEDNTLAGRESISLREIPEQPLLLPDIGGYFIEQIESIVRQERLPIVLVKNDFMITQHLIRTTNFLTTISSLSKELRNDGSGRVLVPFSDPEFHQTYLLSYAETNQKKVRPFLEWAANMGSRDVPPT